MAQDSFYICLLSIHGLVRSHDLELGRDADTGGQIKYVIELASALAQQSAVGKVELLTRLIDDPQAGDDYRLPVEPIAEHAQIIRIQAGPPNYLPKEQLWDYLDSFVDNALEYLKSHARLPDLLHSHYADAGYVGSRLSHILGIPLMHTGHSLGRVKRRRLLAAGLDAEVIEERYSMARRIEAEEQTLASAERVIASTHQEIEGQYGLYDHYQPEQMRVVPPGTDLTRFHPPDGDEWQQPIAEVLRRFLREPEKPLILALSRPDTRKNIGALVTAYGKSKALKAAANLVIIAGNREDIHDLDSGAKEVWFELLNLIDLYDLYGQVAYPKHHTAQQVAQLYRLATASGGVFVNPALTEPFGLTLIEAAASGLPIVATEDGGPSDIIGNCENGILVNPLDTEQIAAAVLQILSNWEDWQQRSVNGLKGVREYYSWPAHAKCYLDVIRPILDKTDIRVRPPRSRRPMLYHDRAIFTDLDQNLLGDPGSLATMIARLRENRKCATFGIATGRRLDSALKVMKRHGIPEPDVLITSGGSQIHYAPKLTADIGWVQHIDHHWTPAPVQRILGALPGLKLQKKSEQSRFKISYYIDPHKAPGVDEINKLLHREEQSVNVILSFGQFLDVLPIRASKGLALRYFAARWGIPLDQILVAGGSGADEDMMRGNTLAVVVANRHHEELSQLVDVEHIYFSSQPYANGIMEAIDHFDFFSSCTVPEQEMN
ncbi:Sucrose phosphate synthase [hydrothermal vent metagenome]|uniref:sucrose-phosphate synthase n=1 Tax=hydrothermal vent metagenome TaxID=652676 RepID=A0A3B0ZLQ3_9ZZZZ